MLKRLIFSEVRRYFVDARFLSVFASCLVLAMLSVTVGGRNYTIQLREYATASEYRRAQLDDWIENGAFWQLQARYPWNRPPEPLSTIVMGRTGVTGREGTVEAGRANIQRQPLVRFTRSPYERNPVYAMFGVLDLAYIVEIIICLAVLLFTHDAICGEKQSGVLRMVCSFPLARSTLAFAKLLGTAAAVLVPTALSFLIACAFLSLSPDVALGGDDWARIVTLVGLYSLYLGVFVSFGLWISAMCHRRAMAFLSLLVLWATWVFLIPSLAVRTAELAVVPDSTFYDLDRETHRLRWELGVKAAEAGAEALARQHPETAGLNAGALRDSVYEHRFDAPIRRVTTPVRDEFNHRLSTLREAYRNQVERRTALGRGLAAVSPFGLAHFMAQDVANTGYAAQARIEDALNHYHRNYFLDYMWAKAPYVVGPLEGQDLKDFAPFKPPARQSLGEVLGENTLSIVLLGLFLVLGFAGAYVSFIRYDVR